MTFSSSLLFNCSVTQSKYLTSCLTSATVLYTGVGLVLICYTLYTTIKQMAAVRIDFQQLVENFLLLINVLFL